MRYYQTIQLGNTSYVYIGRKARVLDTPDSLERIFKDLHHHKDFKDKPIMLSSLIIDPQTISLDIQDPNNEDYFDTYL